MKMPYFFLMSEILLAQFLYRLCHLVTITKAQSYLTQTAGFSCHYFKWGTINIRIRNSSPQRIEDVLIVNTFSLSNYEQ